MRFISFMFLSFNIFIFILSLKIENKLLIVSLDGFRADYLDKYELKNFNKLMYEGIRPNFVKSTFLTKTFPSHITIVTGLYQESHGIISNKMWDRKLKKEFNLKLNTSANNFWYKSVYPIWITAEDNNIKTGIYFWPGSEVSYKNKRSTKFRNYQKKANFTDMINNITHWLNYEDIDFGLMYFNEPDYTSHKYGPFASETIKKVQEMDLHVGYLMKVLNSSPIKDKINVIFLSDHGMNEPKTFVTLPITKDINQFIEKITDITPLLGIFAKPNSKTILFSKFKEYFKNTTNVNIYLKENFPKKYHYTNNERIPDILILANENVSFALEKKNYQRKGIHGYSNDYHSMDSFLIAKGPDIKKSKGSQTDPINQVDIYHLMCALLKIYPKPNNGSLKAVKQFLIKDAINHYIKLISENRSNSLKINTLITCILIVTLIII